MFIKPPPRPAVVNRSTDAAEDESLSMRSVPYSPSPRNTLPVAGDTLSVMHLAPVQIELVQLTSEEVLLLAQGLAGLGRHLVRVPPDVEPVHEAAQRLPKRERLPHLSIDVAAGEPLVSQLGPAVQVQSYYACASRPQHC